MVPLPLAISFLTFVGHLVSAHTPKFRSAHSLNLHPTIHPDLDLTDPKHIHSSEGASLHYHDPHAAFSAIRSFASVHISAFIHPVVILEHSVYVKSTECDSNSRTITVSFKDRWKWAMAIEDWRRNPKFLLVAFVDSCGMGRESGERSVHLVQNFTVSAAQLQVVCQMVELSLTEAIHPERDVTIHVDTFDVHEIVAPAPSSPHMRRQDAHTSADGPPSTPPPPPPSQEDDDGSANSPADGAVPDSSAPSNYTASLTDSQVTKLLKYWSEPADPDPESAGDDQIEYIPQEQLGDAFWTSEYLPLPASDPDAVDGKSLQGRDACRETSGWNPFAFLANCVLLPILNGLLPDDIYKPIETFLTNVSNLLDIKKFYAVLKGFTEIVSLVLSKSGYTPFGELIFDTNTTAFRPLDKTADFGWAYPVLELVTTDYSSSRGKVGAGSLGIFCVGCRIHGFIKHKSKFQFKLIENRFTSAVVEIFDGRIDFAAGLGVLFDLTFKGPIATKNIAELPLSPLNIPGILVIGPFITIDAGLIFEVGAKGKLLARTSFAWSNVTAVVDLVNGRSVIGDWNQMTAKPLTSAELEGYAVLDPNVSMGIMFGITVLKGTLKLTGGVEAKGYLPLRISGTVSAGTGMLKDCNGLDVVLEAKLEIYATVKAGAFSQNYGTKDVTLPVYKGCIGTEKASQIPSLAIDQTLPSLEPASPDLTYVSISAHFPTGEELQMVWLPRPDSVLSAVPPMGILTGPGSIHRVFQSTRVASATKATAGSYDNRVFYYRKKLMKGAGYDFLRLAADGKDQVPTDAVVVILRSPGGRNGATDFTYGVTTEGNFFYLFLCIYKAEDKLPVIMLTESLKPTRLWRNFYFKSCGAAAFTIS